MKPSALSSVLAVAIGNREPVLITGQPGTGKSDIVDQSATKAGANVVYFHGVTADPTDIKGLPWFGQDDRGTGPEASAHDAIYGRRRQPTAGFIPFGDVAKLRDATSPTVAFFDDLGQAAPAVQASIMQLVLARRIGEMPVSPYVTFLAATNRKKDKAGVSGILEPVKSRFTIVTLEPDLDDWCRWALGAGVPVEVVAFARFRPDCITDFKASPDLINSCSPRTLATAGRWVSYGLSPSEEFDALTGAIGEGRAAELVGFLQVWRTLPGIDEIMLNPMTARVPGTQEAATLYALSGLLGRRATAGNMQAIAQYVSRLPEDHQVLTMKVISSRKRKPEEADPMKTAAFIGWAASHPDVLL